MTWLFLGLGLVLVVEGLALALAPSRLQNLLAFLASQPPDRIRTMGLIAVATGVLMVWTVRHFTG